MTTIELEGRLAHLEQEKAELYGQTLRLKAQYAQLANAAAVLGGLLGGLDIARAALWAELEEVSRLKSKVQSPESNVQSQEFARHLAELIERDEFLRTHPRVRLDGSEYTQGLVGPAVEVKPPQHE
jgi:hypothetical protein